MFLDFETNTVLETFIPFNMEMLNNYVQNAFLFAIIVS